MSTIDRRKAPRIKIVEIKPEYSVILEFNNKAVICKLIDLSDGGAQVLVNEQNNNVVSDDDFGKNVIFKCKSKIPPTDLQKDAKIVRYEEHVGEIILALAFR